MSRQKPAGLGTFPLEYAALGLLFKESKHGYLLYQDFVGEFHLIWKAGQANFYAALAGLKASGRVTVTYEAQESNPPRKVFQITDAGRDAFIEWLNTPVTSMRAFRVEFIARLHFFTLLNLPGAGALLQQEMALVQRWLDEWDEPALETQRDPTPAMVADFRRRQARMIIEWLASWQEQLAQTAPLR